MKRPDTLVQIGMANDAVQPGLKAGLVAECMQAPIQVQEDLTDDVARFLIVVAEGIGHSIESLLRAPDQSIPGPSIARLAESNQGISAGFILDLITQHYGIPFHLSVPRQYAEAERRSRSCACRRMGYRPGAVARKRP